MKSQSKVSCFCFSVAIALALWLAWILPPRPLFAGQAHIPIALSESRKLPLDPFRLPPNPWKAMEVDWPESYIHPTIEYALNMVLPETLRQGLEFGAGYDRWTGHPTVTAEYFLPVKAWKDKSLFVAPRISLDATRESFSVAGGLRRLISSEALVGVYAFHDWVRSRGSGSDFLREAGAGLELSALPGRFSDLTVSANVYFPVNERFSRDESGEMLIREALPFGGDARLSFLLPAVTDFLDARVDAAAHRFVAERTDMKGYSVGLTIFTRDGMLAGSVQQATSSQNVEEVRVSGTVNLAFAWPDLVAGKFPFSAPYSAGRRLNRRVQDSLYQRVVRKHDLPADRSARRMALAAEVRADAVSLTGGFSDLANSRVTVQTSQSPWRDRMEVLTDSHGCYFARLVLDPGQYKIRVIHKATGRTSEVRSIVVRP